MHSEPTIIAVPREAGPLQYHPFRLFLAGQTISMLGDAVAPIALAFAVLALTGSSRDVGYLFAARLIPLILFLLAGGVLADRLPRRQVMIAADLARLGSQGTTAILVVSGHATLWQLIALQALHGGASAFFDPAVVGLTAETVPARALQQANAYRGIAIAGSQIAGPILAGVLVLSVGSGWAIGLDALSFAASACFLTALPVTAHLRSTSQRYFLKQLRDGWIEFRSRAWVWSVVAMASIVNALSATLLVLGPEIAKTSLGGPGAWGVILGALGIGAACGAVIALRWKPTRPLAAGVMLTSLLALPEVLLAFGLPTAMIAVGAFAAGAGNTIFTAFWATVLQRKIPSTALGRISAYDWLGSLALRPLGLAATGIVASAVGDRDTLLGAATISLLAISLALAVREVREVRL